MQKKLLITLFFVFSTTNAYGLEWLLGACCCKNVLEQEGRVAEQRLEARPREILMHTYDNDKREPRKDLQRIAMLQEYFLSFPPGLAELIGSYDYTGTRCYIGDAYTRSDGLLAAINVCDEDGEIHMYVAYDTRFGVLHNRIDPTCKAGTMTVKQMQHVYALRKIQNQPFAKQELEDAELVLLQHQHDIPDSMIKLARARRLVTVPGEN